MFAVVVTFHVNQDRMPDFLPLMRRNAANSLRLEPECHRFDVWTDPARPDQVFLYELYSDAAAFETHLASAHFNTFAAAVADMVTRRDLDTWAVEEPLDV
ncbi:MAG: putative quinol monooxygenase [Pseudomonadota bacterium]